MAFQTDGIMTVCSFIPFIHRCVRPRQCRGLLTGSGIGLLVLFRVNHNWKENMGILAGLYITGTVCGMIPMAPGFTRAVAMVVHLPRISHFFFLSASTQQQISVMITQLYLEGVFTFGAMLSGLLTGSGIGLLVLFRVNHNATTVLP